MRILFLHNNFPGQYRRLAEHLGRQDGFELLAGTLASNKQPTPVRRVLYKPHREPSETTHPAARGMEAAVLMAQACYQSMSRAKHAGFSPDVICAHSGWGPAMFLKELWPEAKLISYLEWYYHTDRADTVFLPGAPQSEDGRVRTHMKNMPILADMAIMDRGLSPTAWQASQFPDLFRDRITVLHDGVDTDFFAPDPSASVEFDGRRLGAGDEIVTYVARGMEPYRGFPQFMQAASRLMAERPNLHVVVVGGDRVAYGRKRKDGRSYKQAALEDLPFDRDRLHFTGLVPYGTFRSLMRISSLHIYLTVPFVLSWSMLEAMACGALLLASDTEPVLEVVEDGVNGLLTDFFDVDALVEKARQALDDPEGHRPLREAARQTILDRYSHHLLLPKQQKLIEDVANGSV